MIDYDKYIEILGKYINVNYNNEELYKKAINEILKEYRKELNK